MNMISNNGLEDVHIEWNNREKNLTNLGIVIKTKSDVSVWFKKENAKSLLIKCSQN